MHSVWHLLFPHFSCIKLSIDHTKLRLFLDDDGSLDSNVEPCEIESLTVLTRELQCRVSKLARRQDKREHGDGKRRRFQKQEMKKAISSGWLPSASACVKFPR
jgi:hypothetical protein